MTARRALGWVLLVAYAVWACALDGALAFSLRDFAWRPDLLAVLLVALAARLPAADLPALALCCALARTSVSIDPPVTSFALCLGMVALARVVRGIVDVQGAWPSSVLSGACAGLGVLWCALAHDARLAAARSDGFALPMDWPLALAEAGRRALATALVALALGAASARLPGLGTLWRRTTWHVGASSR